MIFGKKDKNQTKCETCGSLVNEKYSFCPRCGNNLASTEKEQRDYGLLGKDDFVDIEQNRCASQGFGFADKLLNSIFNSMMKNLNKQFRQMEKDAERAEVKSFPNGIRIKIFGPGEHLQKQKPKKKIIQRQIAPEQIKKMNSLPKERAKTSVKRLGNSVIYELATPGVVSPQDIFVSKLESGYEIKAIGSRKVYVNSVPINLPLRQFSLLKNKLLVEFMTDE